MTKKLVSWDDTTSLLPAAVETHLDAKIAAGGGAITDAALAAAVATGATKAQLSSTYLPGVVMTGTGIDATGATDSTAAIRAKLVAGAGKDVVFPPGTYKITDELVVSAETTIHAYGATISQTAVVDKLVLRNASYGGSGARDTGIRIFGGTWTKIAVGGAATPNKHGFAFHRIDGLIVADATFVGGMMRCIQISDSTLFTFRDLHLLGAQVGIQINGPTKQFLLDGIRGGGVDDLIAICPVDWPTLTINPLGGDVTEGTISNTCCVNSYNGVKILGGSQGGTVPVAARALKILGVSGSVTGVGVVIGDDAMDPTTVGGLLDDITIRDVNVATPSAGFPMIVVGGTNIQNVRIDGAAWTPTNNSGDMVRLGGSIASCIIRGLVLQTTFTANLVHVYPGCTVGALSISDCAVTQPAAYGAVIRNDATATTINISNVRQIGGEGFYSHAGAATASTVNVVNSSSGSNYGFYNSALTMTTINCAGVQMANAVTLVGGAGCAMAISGDVTGGMYKSAAQGFRTNSTKLCVPYTWITSRVYGDFGNFTGFNNPGVYVTDGTTWKNIYSGGAP